MLIISCIMSNNNKNPRKNSNSDNQEEDSESNTDNASTAASAASSYRSFSYRDNPRDILFIENGIYRTGQIIKKTARCYIIELSSGAQKRPRHDDRRIIWSYSVDMIGKRVTPTASRATSTAGSERPTPSNSVLEDENSGGSGHETASVASKNHNIQRRSDEVEREEEEITTTIPYGRRAPLGRKRRKLSSTNNSTAPPPKRRRKSTTFRRRPIITMRTRAAASNPSVSLYFTHSACFYTLIYCAFALLFYFILFRLFLLSSIYFGSCLVFAH